MTPGCPWTLSSSTRRAVLIDRFTVPVCANTPCPVFYPTRTWQFAIEAPAGSLDWIPLDAQLRL